MYNKEKVNLALIVAKKIYTDMQDNTVVEFYNPEIWIPSPVLNWLDVQKLIKIQTDFVFYDGDVYKLRSVFYKKQNVLFIRELSIDASRNESVTHNENQ